jgi:hypothetical protein
VGVLPVNWLMHRLNIMGLATPFGIFIHSDVPLKRRVPLIRHELTHQDQMRRLGVRFYIQYLRQYAKYGYSKMPLEIEARESEK